MPRNPPKSLFLLLAMCAGLHSQTITFQQSKINVGCNPTDVAVADFNADGKPDLVFTCKAGSTNPAVVLVGNGDGTFQSPIPVPAPALGSAQGNRLVAVDFNGDGKADLAYMDGAGNLVVLLSSGDGTFHPLSTSLKDPQLGLRAAIDLNKDNLPDLLFFGPPSLNVLTVAMNQGNGKFATPVGSPTNPLVNDPTFTATDLALADFNGDGKRDVVVVGTFAPTQSATTRTPGYPACELLFGRGDGSFDPLFTYCGIQVRAGDFNGDGKLDFVTTGEPGFDPHAVLGPINLSSAGIGIFGTDSITGPIAVGDINGDGKDDLLVGSGEFNSLIAYISNGDGTFRKAPGVALPSGPLAVAVADFDGDGKLDVVTANTSSASILLNSTSFSATTAAINGASFAVGQPIAPGSLASVFGIGFTSSVALASNIPLPLSLGGVSVTIGGVPAPLVFAGKNQINLQVPWTVGPGKADVVVSVNGSALPALSMTIGAVGPGIFSTNFGTGQAVAINPDGTLAGSAGSIPGVVTHPAKPGDTIIVLATGLGAVTPSIGTGVAASDGLRNTVVNPIVLIGGTQAQVAFSGLSPQFVGVYQLNVVVPSVPAGVVSLQIDAGGIRTTDKVTMAVANP